MPSATLPTEVTAALASVRKGAPGAKDRLIELIYHDLQSAAKRVMSRERKDHTLQPTALVNESLMRLMQTTTLSQIEDRGHLLAAATVAFKRVLIDHARARGTQKRGGGRRRESLSEAFEEDLARVVAPETPDATSAEDGAGDASPFDPLLEWYDHHGLDIMALDVALDEMRELEQRWFDVVLLRFFGGFTIEQAADLLGVSPRTVAQDWNHARAWLRVRLGDEHEGSGADASGEGALPGGEPSGG